jgi:hypothetical protein
MRMSHVDVRIVIYKLFAVQEAGVRTLAESWQSCELYCSREWREHWPSSSTNILFDSVVSPNVMYVITGTAVMH